MDGQFREVIPQRMIDPIRESPVFTYVRMFACLQFPGRRWPLVAQEKVGRGSHWTGGDVLTGGEAIRQWEWRVVVDCGAERHVSYSKHPR